MIPIFSVDLIVFTVLGYPVSYIEFFGTGLYLWSVWLIARRNRLTWPVGLVSVLLFLVIYYQIRLYSDMLEQVYYLGASLYGWWYWSRTRSAPNAPPAVRYSTGRSPVKPVPGVTVNLAGSKTGTQTTGVPGTYLFGSFVGDTTIVTCSKSTPGNAQVTAADLLLTAWNLLVLKNIPLSVSYPSINGPLV